MLQCLRRAVPRRKRRVAQMDDDEYTPTRDVDMRLVSQLPGQAVNRQHQDTNSVVRQGRSTSPLSQHPLTERRPVDTIKREKQGPNATVPRDSVSSSLSASGTADQNILPASQSNSAAPYASLDRTWAPAPHKRSNMLPEPNRELLSTTGDPTASPSTPDDQVTPHYHDAFPSDIQQQGLTKTEGVDRGESECHDGICANAKIPSSLRLGVGDDVEYTMHQRPAITHEEIFPHTHTIYQPSHTYSIHIHEHRTLFQPIVEKDKPSS